MQTHSRLSYLLHIVLLFTLVNFHSASQSDLRTENFIESFLYCNQFDMSYSVTSQKEHYFRMFSTNVSSSPPESFKQIADSAERMLSEWFQTTNQMVETFKKQYLNINTYTSTFVDQRFNPMVNLVWKEIISSFGSEARFTDWVAERGEWLALNEFTNLVDAQFPLIEEFATLNNQVVEGWMENLQNIVGEMTVDGPELYKIMRQETVAYLALIFMAAFEYKTDDVFYTNDNILENFWRVFFPWLDLKTCNNLVNAAYSGNLSKVTNRSHLNSLLSANVPEMHMDAIKLKFEEAKLNEFINVLPEAEFIKKNGGKFLFYTEQNLNEIIDITEIDSVDERIKFDKIRIEEPKECLAFVAEFDSFLSMREVFTHGKKNLVDTYYYFFIEYLSLRIKDTTEFPDQLRAKRAIQIIYIFMNQILNEDGDKMKTKGPAENVIHIITRILNGLMGDGELRRIVQINFLDEETENYIYMLFLIITESNNLPKPSDSGELDRTRNNSIIDEDPEDPFFRVDPRNPRYAYVVRRLFELAGKTKTAGIKYVTRYHKKYFNQKLLGDNPIFAEDDKFYILERNMNIEFSSKWTFAPSKAAYETEKSAYLKKVTQKNTNMPIRMLMVYFSNEYKNYRALKAPEGCTDPKKWMKNKYNEIFLGNFGKLRSNFMEMQYVEAILLTCHSTKVKLPLPDFEFLLSEKMVDDNGSNLFEFMKRVITNMKHTKSQNKVIMQDTLDIDGALYDDKSHVTSGERFHTMLLDITHFFKPEMDRLVASGIGGNNAKLEYKDMSETIKNIDQQFALLSTNPVDVEVRNLRMMMTWNIFDDIEEYLPLLGKFIEETKTQDMQGSNPLKMEMLVEGYTNLYIAMLEHRLFAANHKFSFENSNERALNLLAYLKMVDSQYEAMFKSALPDKEQRFSKLNARQVQNLIYFLTFRIKMVVEQTGEDSGILLTHQYYPFAFREIYVLLDNHPEMKTIIELECAEMMRIFEEEKYERGNDYKITTFTDEQKNAPGFKFCMLIRFNRDMIGLVDNQATLNKDKEVMLTITREAILQELVIPFYDKLNAHELIIQVFNLNMNHAKAAARESAQKFSNYIALLDAFLFILDDLEDGNNDSLNVQSMPKGPVSAGLRNFCLQIEATDEPQNKVNNLIFIRHMLLDKLNPGYLAPGKNLRDMYATYTTSPMNSQKMMAYIGRLRYGPTGEFGNIDLNVEGSEIDTELISLLMIYAPHREFTANLLFEGNFISTLPKYLRMAEDNVQYLNKHYPKETTVEAVFVTAYNKKMEIIKATTKRVDDDVEIDLDQELDFDLDFGDEEDNVMNQTSSMWESEYVETTESKLDSNIQKEDEITKILIGEEVERVEVGENSVLADQVIFIDQIVKESLSGEMDADLINVMKSEDELLSKSDSMKFNGVQVIQDEIEFEENTLEAKDFNQVTSRSGITKTTIKDENLGLLNEFSRQVTEDRTQEQINCVSTFKIRLNQKNVDPAKIKLLEAAAKKIAMSMNSANYKVHVTSTTVVTSKKLSTKMSTHLSEEKQAFDDENRELHISGAHNSEINMVVGGITDPMSISSTKFNGALNNAVSAKQEVNTLIKKGITSIVTRSKTYSGATSTPKVQVKRSSSSSKFLRLV